MSWDQIQTLYVSNLEQQIFNEDLRQDPNIYSYKLNIIF